MKRFRFWLCLASIAFVSLSQLTVSADESREDPQAQAKVSAQRAWVVMETILDRHMNPPTRQHMLQLGLRNIFNRTKGADELHRQLARTISNLSDQGATVDFLAEQFLKGSQERGLTLEQVEGGFVSTALFLSGSANYTAAENAEVEKQVLENRYVGIGIALMKEGDDGPSIMREVFHRGPAHRAGAKNGDIMLSIDGTETKNMSLEEIIAKLRGQEGKPVTIVVTQPGSNEQRTLNITRGVAPIETVVGLKRNDDGEWNYAVPDMDNCAYLKINAIRGSTVNELRETARKLQAQECRTLVLDLRGIAGGELRHAAMIADLFLGETLIGTTVIRDHRKDYRSNGDSLFPGWPMAIVIDQTVYGQGEWIAASLQQRVNTFLVGTPTIGAGFVTERVKLPYGATVELRVGVFERPDGRSLASEHLNFQNAWFDRTRQVASRSREGAARALPTGNGIVPDVTSDKNAVELATAELKKRFSKNEVGETADDAENATESRE